MSIEQPATLPAPGAWTVDAVRALLPADDGTRYEVIEGVLHVTHAPHWEHQGAEGEIFGALWLWSKQSGAGVVRRGVGIIFAADEAVIPDVVWVAAERLAHVLGSDGKLHAAPDLVVEVLSGSAEDRQRDRETKRALYSRHGVREYWIGDRFQRCVEVYRPATAGGALVLAHTCTAGEVLTSPLLPGFAVAVAEVFG